MSNEKSNETVCEKFNIYLRGKEFLSDLRDNLLFLEANFRPILGTKSSYSKFYNRCFSQGILKIDERYLSYFVEYHIMSKTVFFSTKSFSFGYEKDLGIEVEEG